MNYWIERWADLRKKEIIDYPEHFPINNWYTKQYSQEELIRAFKVLHETFVSVYKKIVESPERMLLPIFNIDEFGYFSKEARLSREMSYKYAYLFYALGLLGEYYNDDRTLVISIKNLNDICKKLGVTYIAKRLSILTESGFEIKGIDNGKYTKGEDNLIVTFPKNHIVLYLLNSLADKADKTGRLDEFCKLNYKLLKDDPDTADFGHGVDYVTDLFKTENEKIVASKIHDELLKRGYIYNRQGWNEGNQIRYYKNEKDMSRNANSNIWIVSLNCNFRLFIRIRDIDNALDYIKTCPESVVNTFLETDEGCKNRGISCKSGIQYNLNGKTIWRCGCCNPNFQAKPELNDYMFYINAVDSSYKNK